MQGMLKGFLFVLFLFFVFCFLFLFFSRAHRNSAFFNECSQLGEIPFYKFLAVIDVTYFTTVVADEIRI